MELIKANFANTTTQFVVNDNTASVANIMVRDQRYQFYSVNFANDSTTVSMRINFSQTMTVDRIALVGHNLKSFTLYYNGNTASTFALDSSADIYADTTVSDYISNSNTAQYFCLTPVNCTSVSIDMKATITPNQNKYIGYLVVSEKMTDFGGRVPHADGYTPQQIPRNVKHQLADGGIRIHSIDEKWAASVKFDYLTQTVRDELKDIYDNHEEMVFVPFGSADDWDGHIYPCIWDGPFDFYKYSDNAATSGFSGSLTLLETPK
jgi:hypothetical protein